MLDRLFATHTEITDAPDSLISLLLAGAGLLLAAGSMVAYRAARTKPGVGVKAPAKHGWALVLLIDAIMSLSTAAVILLVARV